MWPQITVTSPHPIRVDGGFTAVGDARGFGRWIQWTPLDGSWIRHCCGIVAVEDVDDIEKANRRGRFVAGRARIVIIPSPTSRNGAYRVSQHDSTATAGTLHDDIMDDGGGTRDHTRRITAMSSARPCATSRGEWLCFVVTITVTKVVYIKPT